MKFIAIKPFSSMRWGNVKVGDEIELSKDIARQMIDAKMVKLHPDSVIELQKKQAEQQKIAEKSKK